MPGVKPTFVHGPPADPGPVLDLLARGWTEPEGSLQRQTLERALATSAGHDFVCVRAVIGNQLAGVVLAQKLPGRTAAVWPPQLAESSPPELTTRLLTAVENELQSAGTRLAQALLAPDQVAEQASLRAAGYANAATLLYMACDSGLFPDEPPAMNLTLDTVTPASEPQLEAIIEASYQGTLDCPLLDGLRTPGDVLAGYRAVGAYRPELWLLARCGNDDAGCLILADHPQVDHLELVYLGVIPAARGHGYGLALTRHALWLARQFRRQRVVLAVDAANAPAISVYEAAGFFGFDQRLVIIKKL
jgi:ribosomal protein S18 acetylase RimI-like enzyme